jgi:hypothetical protein
MICSALSNVGESGKTLDVTSLVVAAAVNRVTQVLICLNTTLRVRDKHMQCSTVAAQASSSSRAVAGSTVPRAEQLLQPLLLTLIELVQLQPLRDQTLAVAALKVLCLAARRGCSAEASSTSGSSSSGSSRSSGINAPAASSVVTSALQSSLVEPVLLQLSPTVLLHLKKINTAAAAAAEGPDRRERGGLADLLSKLIAEPLAPDSEAALAGDDDAEGRSKMPSSFAELVTLVLAGGVVVTDSRHT